MRGICARWRSRERGYRSGICEPCSARPRCPAGTFPRDPPPIPAIAFAMPAQNGLWPNDHQRRPPTQPVPTEPDPEQPVRSAQPRARLASLEDFDLLAQREDLEQQIGAGVRGLTGCQQERVEQVQHGEGGSAGWSGGSQRRSTTGFVVHAAPYQAKPVDGILPLSASRGQLVDPGEWVKGVPRSS